MRPERRRRAFVGRLECLGDAVRRVGALGRQGAISELGLVFGDWRAGGKKGEEERASGRERERAGGRERVE